MSKMVKQKSPTAAAKVMIAYKIVWDLFCLIVINNPPKFAVIRSLVYYIIKHRIFQGQGSQVYVNNGKKAEVTRRRDSGGANPRMGNIPISASRNAVGTTARNISERRRYSTRLLFSGRLRDSEPPRAPTYILNQKIKALALPCVQRTHGGVHHRKRSAK